MILTALIVIGCILLFFVFVLSLKAKITVIYDGEVALYLKVLFIKIKLLPKNEKKKGPHSMSEKKAKKIKAKLDAKAQKKRLKKKQKKESKLAKKHEPKQKKSLSEVLDVINLVKELVSTVIKKFFGHLKIDVARLKINVATGDAATTAIAYGAILQAAMYLFTALAPVKGFSFPNEKNTDIRCDYLSDSMTVDIKISFSLRVWHVFHVAFAALGKLISHKLKSIK